jgi:hypothetical protein
MEPISHQMQKLHLLQEEERSPSLQKTKPMEMLSLKAIRNHPYQTYKRQHRHIDKHSKTTQGSIPSTTWGQIKCLTDMAKKAIKEWETGRNSCCSSASYDHHH